MFKKKNENVMTILKRSSGLKYKMIIHSFVVGLLAGGIIVGYRLLGEVLLKSFKKALQLHVHIGYYIVDRISLYFNWKVFIIPKSGRTKVKNFLLRRDTIY
ncbi:MAG: hypothetical protein E7G73_05305 [Peptostreptococcus sp.]|nr:hypothetical protein [Peptostreptococcus sp.]